MDSGFPWLADVTDFNTKYNLGKLSQKLAWNTSVYVITFLFWFFFYTPSPPNVLANSFIFVIQNTEGIWFCNQKMNMRQTWMWDQFSFHFMVLTLWSVKLPSDQKYCKMCQTDVSSCPCVPRKIDCLIH